MVTVQRLGMAALAFGIVGTLDLAQAATAPDFYDGLRAYDARQIDKAVAEWTAAAQAGDLRSQKQLGDLYKDGRRVPQDFAQAYRWFLAAATNPAELKGGAPERTLTGASLPDLSDVKAEATASAQTVRRYLTEADLFQVHRELDGRFKADGASGLQKLGGLYREGKLLPENKVEALKFYVLAAFLGAKDAAAARDNLVSGLEPPQIAAAQRAAVEWLKAEGISKVSAGAFNEPEKAAPLAPAKDEQAEAKPATPKAAAPVKQATKDDDEEPAEEVRPAPKQSEQSLQPNYLGTKRGNLINLNASTVDTQIVQQALQATGFYRGRINGDFGPQTARAISAFQRSIRNAGTGQLSTRQFERLMLRAARDAKNPVSQYNYGRLLIVGRYIDRDPQEAVRWLSRAGSEGGIADAAFMLGCMYRDGVGLARNQRLATSRFREADRLGHPKAGQALRALPST